MCMGWGGWREIEMPLDFSIFLSKPKCVTGHTRNHQKEEVDMCNVTCATVQVREALVVWGGHPLR